jgi:hypothetical protein
MAPFLTSELTRAIMRGFDRKSKGVMFLPQVLEALSPELLKLAEKANREHDLVLEAGTSMVAHAVKAGEALLEAKKLVPAGEWSGGFFPTSPIGH